MPALQASTTLTRKRRSSRSAILRCRRVFSSAPRGCLGVTEDPRLWIRRAQCTPETGRCSARARPVEDKGTAWPCAGDFRERAVVSRGAQLGLSFRMRIRFSCASLRAHHRHWLRLPHRNRSFACQYRACMQAGRVRGMRLCECVRACVRAPGQPSNACDGG
jgi:hypothetical protein